MSIMYEPHHIQPIIQSLQRALKNGNQLDDLRLIEDKVNQIIQLLHDYKNLKHAIDASIIVAATSLSGKIIYANERFCKISKYKLEDLIGKDHRVLNSGHHNKAFFKKMWETIKKGDIWQGEIKNKARDGSFYWVQSTIVPIRDENGKQIMYISLRTEITEGKIAQEKLLAALKNDFRFVVNSMYNHIYKVMKKGTHFIYTLNEGKLAADLGLDNGKMYNKSPKEVYPQPIADMLEEKYEKAFSGEMVTFTTTLQNRNLVTHLTPITNDGVVNEVIACVSDITDLSKAQEEVKYIAFHDLLTNLPNRRKFMNDMKYLIQDAKRNERPFSVFFLDLDRFKQINDSLGHTVGDHLIIEVTKRLKASIGLLGNIYRFAGDEFIIVFPNSDGKMDVHSLAEQVVDIFKSVFILPNSLEIYTSASIGVSIYPEHGEDDDTLLKNADTAMYYAKSVAKNTYQLYETSMSQQNEETLKIEHHLRSAIEKNELELYYQPKFDLLTNRVTGVEALLRWHSSILGEVPVTKFIPIAEETGLIFKLDEWVLKKACEQSRKWNALNLSYPLTMAVNISPLHFRLPNFVHFVDRVLKKTCLEPSLLEIEITEGCFIDNADECIIYLTQLKNLGVSVAIDDFGKGYSSLNYLRKFPINSLKIDREFIHEVEQNADDIAIVKAIIFLSHELKLKVVAEGTETKEVIEILKGLGCNEVQGYYISEPLPSNEIERIISEINSKDEFFSNS
ncbi:EAL domain-containing protein [Cytobacillus sp. FJAT-54145]|uniref:EAL domain-containing protein n=1 Tax=Cytobacillus spartinae TaxID=3299023 RepID=A0ABW6K640_9BACI